MNDTQPVTTDVQPADSSSAPAEPVDQLASLSSSELTTFYKDGVLPSTDATAESSTAQPDGQAASTDASSAPASEPGKPAKGSKLKARNDELDAENRALQEKLRIRHTLREELARTERPTPDAKPDSSPKATEWERYLSHPNAPKEEDFTDYRQFTAAMGVFVARQVQRDEQARARFEGERQQHADRVKASASKAIERIDAYKKTVPDFDSKVNPQLLDITPASLMHPSQVQCENALAQELVDSEYLPQLMEHYSTPEGIAEWQQMLRMSPTAAIRTFGRIEARFESRASVDARPPKTVTSAPDPPTTLGRKPAAPADEIAEAIRTGNYAAFERAENARDLAARR